MTHSSKTTYRHESNTKVTLKTVPKVRLYVERREEQEHWFVNIGHVTERGRWRTEPHAHPGYGQIIFVRSGNGVMNLEGSSVPFEGPCVLLLPTECVHGLDYENDVDRWVVTIEVAYLAQIYARLHEFIQLWSLPRVIAMPSTSGTATEFFSLITRLAQELESKAFGHVVGAEALLTQLFLILVRQIRLDQPDDGGASRNETCLAERYRELIEQHYWQNLPLQDYASMMGVSVVQLRAACAAATRQSPTKMIHARIITEAKRNLIFGEKPIEQIAFGLGFSDAAYFTRFFRREVGEAPSQFRLTAREQPQRAK
ncbi:helix-turn-helix domain-containing protein [Pseudomonas sp. TE3610]